VRAEFHPSQELLREAHAIVESDEVLRIFAASEWDELSEDGQVWIAAIVKLAQERARGVSADIVQLPVLPTKLVNMPRRSEDPRLARGNDNGPDFLGERL
jgi:hypothetical protein